MRKAGLVLFASLFVMLWSSGWTASHFLATESSALSILSARYVLLLAMLLIIVTVLGQWQVIPRRDFLLHLLIGALCHAVYLLGSISAFELGVSAAVVAFINALQPAATATLGNSISGEHTPARHVIGLLLGVLSIVFIVSDSYYHSDVSSFALLLPLLAMLALCTGLLLNRRLENSATGPCQKPRPVMLLLLIHATGALIIILPLAVLSGDLHWQFTSVQWRAIVWLALMVSLGSYAILLLLLRHITTLRATSLTYLVPPTTLLQSYFFFGETLSAMSVLALGIAIVSVYLILTNSPATTTFPPMSIGSARAARYRLDQLLKKPVATKSF